MLGIAAAVAVVCWLLWYALEDTLRDARVDDRVVWVPMVTMAVAGALWGAVSRGRAQAARIAAGLAAGAVTGALGALLAGRAKPHIEAAATGKIDIGNIVVWALIGAAAWAITLGAASSPERRVTTMLGAGVGGAASGALMGAMLGHDVTGSPPKVMPTDIWWSLPLRAADVGPRVIPVLLVGIVVPMLCASPVRRVNVTLLRAAVAALVLIVCGVALAQRDDAGATTVERTTDHTDDGTDTLPDITVPQITMPDTVAPETTEDTTPALDTDVPFPEDPGFEVDAAYDGTAANDAGETAAVQIAFGPAHVADGAVPRASGQLDCPLGPNDAFFPFLVLVSAHGLDTSTKVRVAFGQGGVEGADPAAHPLSVQWNYAGGRQCLPGTQVATADDAPSSVWATLKDGDQQLGYGYLVVADYFDPATGDPAASASAGIGVSVVIDDQYTTSEWTLTGGAVGTVHDPNFGDYGAVLFG